MGLAGAAGGAAQGLRQILEQRRLRELMAQAQQQQAIENDRAEQQSALQREQFAAGEAERTADRNYRTQQTERQTRLDTEAAGDRARERSEAANARGMRQMIAGALRQKTATPEAAAQMAFGEGVDVDLDTLDPDRGHRQRLDLTALQHKNELQQIAAQGAESRKTAVEKAKTDTSAPSPYTDERARRTVQSVDDLLGKVNRWTTGIGSALARIPETDARNFRAELDTLKSNVAFNELQQMREASKTGGALGAVSERELALLESTLGALDPGQSPENLKQQLRKVKESVTRWEMARGGGAQPGRTGGGLKVLSVEEVP